MNLNEVSDKKAFSSLLNMHKARDTCVYIHIHVDSVRDESGLNETTSRKGSQQNKQEQKQPEKVNSNNKQGVQWRLSSRAFIYI